MHFHNLQNAIAESKCTDERDFKYKLPQILVCISTNKYKLQTTREALSDLNL